MTDTPTPPPLPSQPLDYSGRRGGFGAAGYAGGASIFSVVRFLAAMVVMLILIGIFMLVIPRLEAVYADFGIKLPWITQLVLDVSRFLQAPLGWVVAALVAGGVALMLAVLPIRGRWLRLLILLTLALIVIALSAAVLLPMVNLMESLTSNPGKL